MKLDGKIKEIDSKDKEIDRLKTEIDGLRNALKRYEVSLYWNKFCSITHTNLTFRGLPHRIGMFPFTEPTPLPS